MTIKIARSKKPVTFRQLDNAKRYAEYAARLAGIKEPLIQLWSKPQ